MSQSSTADADADADDNGDNADEGEEGAMMDGPCFYCESDAHASCDCPHRRPDDPPLSKGVGSGGGAGSRGRNNCLIHSGSSGMTPLLLC